ncbi:MULTISPECIES: ORF6N domain-containing protein [unclassified Adlercreutzia]|uniref:ORF6N domain-containing protein n=1 Tax=unclassified Adlercreutzia TaxID=2636013 RepID=UPI0013EB6C46|nr:MULTISPECIES: ORF6N domain-containing protein [unclassified Adlercreutzia]
MASEEKGPSAEPVEAEEDTSAAIVPVSGSAIRDLIYTIRGTQVMLDSDLATLYQVETKRINEAVRRNRTRFPEEFCFRVTKAEENDLRSQIATLRPDLGKQDSWWRYPPQAFTEQGVAMLSAVLRSQVAIDVSVQIMKSFVEMRHFIAGNAAMFEQVRGVELKLLEYQRTTDERFERVFDYMGTHEAPRQKVFFDGQVWDAFELLVSLVRRAERSIVLVDGYVDAGTLNILAKKQDGVNVTVWTHPRTNLTQRDVATFNAQYPRLAVEHTTAFHDRFLILDGVECYLVGASLKDAGKKSFAITRIEDEESVRAILARLER